MTISRLNFAVIRGNKKLVELLLKSGEEDPVADQSWMLAKASGREDIANMLPISYDLNFVPNLLRYLNYDTHAKGVCLGFVHLAKHFIASRHVDEFNALILMIANFYFAVESRTANEMDLHLPLHENDRYSEAYVEAFKNNLNLELDVLRTSDMPSDRQKYIDIKSFCDDIYLYQVHPGDPSLYGSESYNVNVPAAAQQTDHLLILNDAHLDYRGQFAGIYSVASLTSYLQMVAAEIEKSSFSRPVSIVFMGNHHAISAAYDPLHHQWVLVNSAAVPIQISNEVNVVASNILKWLDAEKSKSIISAFYAASVDRDNMTHTMRSLIKHPEWKSVHNHPGKAGSLSIFARRYLDHMEVGLENKMMSQYIPEFDDSGSQLPVYQEIKKYRR